MQVCGVGVDAVVGRIIKRAELLRASDKAKSHSNETSTPYSRRHLKDYYSSIDVV